jgi:hypothetical protein
LLRNGEFLEMTAGIRSRLRLGGRGNSST